MTPGGVAVRELRESRETDGPPEPREIHEELPTIAKVSNFSIGIIGMGLMGRMYANRFSEAGYCVNACDHASKYQQLQAEYAEKQNVNIMPNGHLVSRISDWIIYSVEAELIDKVVEEYGPSTKVGAIVGGQTSCKAPELAAFEKHLPSDVEIVTCHSLHGPGVDPTGQPLVIIKHRASQKSLETVQTILSCLRSKMILLTGEEHDRITADTQAVTHVAFLSMGSAWAANNQFPWEVDRYAGGIENAKINIMMRIYSNKWHVYAGLAILNPAAQKQIRQYATSVTELYKLMLEGRRADFENRIRTAGRAVFKEDAEAQDLLLSDDLLDKFSLSSDARPRRPNNHLSLLAIVDCWWKLGIVPYNHMICSTPLFRIWLGVTEYLYRNDDMLSEAIETAINDLSYRSDDLEFTFAARAWADTVTFGSFKGYRNRFESFQRYFAPRFDDAVKIGQEMIKTIQSKTLRT